MKCPKCGKEIDKKCKFCSSCGGKIEEKITPAVEDFAKTCSKIWYVVGYVGAKSTEKELKEFEESIKKCDAGLFDWYNEVVIHWKEWAKENNEKNKKKDGSKRTGVSKTKIIKTAK